MTVALCPPVTRTPGMTKNSKRPADIKTDRYRSELPILDRLLPLDPPLESSAQERVEDVPEDSSSGDRLEGTPETVVGRPGHAAEPRSAGISMNSQYLEYDQPSLGVSWGRRVLGALLPAAAAAVAVGSLLAPVAAAAQDTPGSDLDIKSVRFDLGSPETGQTTAYRSMVIIESGVEQNLQPMVGSVRVTMSEPDAAAMTAVVGGVPMALGEPTFTDALAGALSSSSVADVARLGAAEGDGEVAVDVFYDRPLGPGDHLLIQESNGDGGVNLTPLDANGLPTGVSVRIGSPYQVNTGHSADPAAGQAAWASVVDVRRFGTGSAPVAGIRLSAKNAEVKAVALVAAEASGLTATAAADGEAPMYASVGLEAKVQPALAVDGAGCLASPASSVAVGQAATFCFLVTNLGTTNLTDLRVTDPQLGLVNAELPLASGQLTLQPGDQAVLYHHTVAGERSDQVNTIVSARPVDGAGNPITNLIAPTGVAGPGAIGLPPTEPPTAPQPEGSASAGALTAADTGQAEMVEVPATRANGTEAPGSEQAASEASVSDVAATTATSATEAAEPAPTQLAMTGIRTEPWILVVLAMGLIFTGYTAYAAFAGATRNGEVRGHDHLDFLGFD